MARTKITADDLQDSLLTQIQTGGVGASSNTQILFNDSGYANGSSTLTLDKATGTLTAYNILPAANNTYSLGNSSIVWKDIYIGPGSLYINGKEVLSESANTIIVSTDINQGLALQTSGTGGIVLDPQGTGSIQVKNTLQILAGKSITSSDGSAIGIGNPIAVDSITSKSANADLTLTANGSGSVRITDDLIVSGNIIFTGTAFTVNTQTVSISDNIIDLNSDFTTGTPTENAGIRVIRGNEVAVVLRWNESLDRWEYTNDGTNYNILGQKGDKGEIGDKGDKGEKGDVEAQGAKGEKGDKGDTGEKGDKGIDGSIGVDGAKGDKGDKGVDGTIGVDGAKGDKGDTGVKGDPGVNGGFSVTLDSFTANGSANSFQLSTTPVDENHIIVVIGGVVQLKDSYSLNGANVELTEAPANTDVVEITTLNGGIQGDKGDQGEKGDKGVDGSIGINGDKGEKGEKGAAGGFGITVDSFTANGTQDQFTLSTTPIDENHIIVVINSVVQLKDAYSVSGSVLTISEAPESNSSIEVSTFSGGTKGEKGDTGIQGDKGTTGDKGDVGPTGDKGDTGQKGDKGDAGAAGDKGDTGATGDKGDTGQKGDKGDAGITGDKGDAGSKGDKGDLGDKGDKGDTGASGTNGDKGDKGDLGPKGETGEFGGATFDYTFDVTTGDDPADGALAFNTADFSTANTMNIDDTDANSTDITSFIQTIDDSTSSIKGHVKITDSANTLSFVIFEIVGTHTEHLDHYHVPVSYVSGITSPFANNTSLIVTFARTGDIGDKGEKGDKGDVGAAGSKGDKGDTGSKGDKGDTGSAGDKGDTGSKGDTGAAGDKGETGQKGDKGEVGAAGDKGDTGATGDKGETGQKGDKGEEVSSAAFTDANNTLTFTNSDATTFDVTGVKGQKGEKGADGVGGGGGGGGAFGITVDSFTANGTGNTYGLSVTPLDENHITVVIDGITQLKSAYSVSANTLTLAGNPANGSVVEVSTYASAPLANGLYVTVDSFTGNGAANSFTLSTAPANENYTFVSVNGILQHKNAYSVSGSSLVLSENIANNDAVEVVTLAGGIKGDKGEGGTSNAVLYTYNILFGGG